MQKFFRSLIAVGVAFGLAACGDDVSITEPPVPDLVVTGAPVTAIRVGDKVQLSANQAVTWSSSATNVASVDAAGLVTAVAPGTASITATSSADASKKASVTITVSTAGTAPAAISIQKVTVAGDLNNPVDFQNVQGQIDVTMNVDPGDQTVTKVELLLDGAVVYSQAFAGASTQLSDVDLALAVSEVVGSINTADYNTTTGVAKYLNGARALSARAQLATGTSVATPSITLQFNNVNRFIETLSLGGTRATANSSGGLKFERGSLTVSVLPVIYKAGVSMASGSVSFGGCDAFGTRTASLTAPAGGTGAWTVTFAQTGTTAATNVSNYEYICAGAGENASLSAVDNAGNSLFSATAPFGTPANPAPLVRLDNKAPGAPTFMANPNGRQNGWINAGVGLTGQNTSSTDNDWLVNGTADAGVGGYVRMARFGADVATANATAGSATPTLPAPSAANTSYCAVISAADLLGNESALPSNSATCTAPQVASFTAVNAQHMRFGVDIAAPTIAFSGGLASNARINAATVNGEFTVTVADTGAVGNSGMLGGTPVAATVTLRNAAGSSGCYVGTVVSGVCTASGTGLAPALPLVSTTTLTAENDLGYYTYTGYAQDAAGNKSGTVTRVVVRDNTPAAASNPAVPLTITGAFTASSFLNDDLSLRDYYYTVAYNGYVGTFALAAAPTAVDAYNAATFTNTNFALNTSINTIWGLQDGTGGAPNAYTGTFGLNNLNLFVRDQTQAAYTMANTGLAVTPPAAGVSVTNFTNYAFTSSQTTICAGTLPAGCGATPTSTNLAAVATGATAVFNNPFSRVDFYGHNGADYVLLGSVPAASANLVDNGATRVWTYTFALSGSAAGSALGTGVPRNLIAFGVSPAGTVALVSAQVLQTINP